MYHILEQLKKHKNHTSFHMPGHKSRGGMLTHFPCADIDITELGYSDDLSCPDGIIDKAQKDIAEILGANRAYILTDGSTLGVMAMIFALSKRGKKVIVSRDCHKSVYNACRLFSLTPVVIDCPVIEGILYPPHVEDIEQELLNNDDISGMVVTSPTYFGAVAPLKGYAQVLKKHNALLAVDGAHGAHLKMEEGELHPSLYADTWVDGAHKTLSTLTQGSILCLNNLALIEDIEEGLSLIRTTSPSYIIMASVEYGVKYLQHSRGAIALLKDRIDALLEKNRAFKICDDWAKLRLDCAMMGVCSQELCEYLEGQEIYVEISDGRYVLFYLSPQTTVEEIDYLERIVCSFKGKNAYEQSGRVYWSKSEYDFLEAVNSPYEWVDLSKAQNRICAQNVGITPPCVPIIIAGQRVLKEQIDQLLTNKKTFGLRDNKIKVIKN